MKNFLFIIICFVFFVVYSSPILAVDPTPTIEPVPTSSEKCPDNGTVYPPNSSCYTEAKKFEVQQIDLLGDQLFTYPLTCISAPEVLYNETVITSDLPPSEVTVNISTDLSKAQLGFLGPDSDTLSRSSPDKLAQKYLFSALFDRPGTNPDAPKEAYRTFWRMLDHLSQAQLKAFFLEHTDHHSYFYVGSDNKQHEVILKDLKDKLPTCLKKYSSVRCWKDDQYIADYIDLNQATKDEYDALLPFDFSNMRSYIVLGGQVAKENIPYLQAVLSGLKGQGNLFSSVPGLVDYYTPSWAIQKMTQYISVDTGLEILQYPGLILRSSLSSCSAPSKTISLSSPLTYPDPVGLGQSLTVPVTNELIESTPDQCLCDPDTKHCYVGTRYISSRCDAFSNDEDLCNELGCIFIPGEETYGLTGSATGLHATVFNNPYIDTLSDLILGGEDPVGSGSGGPIASAIADLANDIIGFFSKSQPGLFRMFVPSYAPDPSKKLITAQGAKTTSDNPNAKITKSGSIIRENNLAQDTMHLLQNCWLVPSDQQTSSKCGLKLTQTCNGERLKEILGDSVTPPSSYAENYFNDYVSPRITPEVVSAYSVAEAETGVPCEVLAAVHYREGGCEPGRSLQDGRPLSGITLEESAIKAGQDILGKAGGEINDLDTLIKAVSRYNGGGNSNCQPSGSCPEATTLDRCGMTVACSTDPSFCFCTDEAEVGSCRQICGRGDFPWPIDYSYCPADLKEGYDDPYATSKWLSPQNDRMSILFLYDCTQTRPIDDPRPGVIAITLSYYLSSSNRP